MILSRKRHCDQPCSTSQDALYHDSHGLVVGVAGGLASGSARRRLRDRRRLVHGKERVEAAGVTEAEAFGRRAARLAGVSPWGSSCGREGCRRHFCDRQLIRNVAMHCQNIRIKCLMWYGSGVHVNIPFHICFTSVLEILLFRKGERETTLTSHRGGKWIDVKLI